MGERLKKGLLLLVYSAGCGIFLFVFTIMKGMANLVFSLLAILIAIHYFKRFSSIRSRVAFIVTALLIFFISVFIYAVITASQTAP
ncbi:hypothetical protein [Paenibacillus sacheonensis]|uniref:Uncharacterized protein n=1 Tax=Paenibacillus sacheonensis TaxID=742054 RepID=A0A7X4YRL9_9BACL|nr:hypothetical protein [Paenibacillus sacheonensis]MBM7563501.1 glycerol-3-phosphate acyltransferase PlsY [Paenibacillus sacheonensis]NBC71200.1 hypothetical protein [Paenibacillus sacheonensis]